MCVRVAFFLLKLSLALTNLFFVVSLIDLTKLIITLLINVAFRPIYLLELIKLIDRFEITKMAGYAWLVAVK